MHTAVGRTGAGQAWAHAANHEHFVVDERSRVRVSCARPATMCLGHAPAARPQVQHVHTGVQRWMAIGCRASDIGLAQAVSFVFFTHGLFDWSAPPEEHEQGSPPHRRVTEPRHSRSYCGKSGPQPRCCVEQEHVSESSCRARPPSVQDDAFALLLVHAGGMCGRVGERESEKRGEWGRVRIREETEENIEDAHASRNHDAAVVLPWAGHRMRALLIPVFALAFLLVF